MQFSTRLTCQRLLIFDPIHFIVLIDNVGPTYIIWIDITKPDMDMFANHQPLNRQSEQFECEGIALAWT
jgi:hypothetical protein